MMREQLENSATLLKGPDDGEDRAVVEPDQLRDLLLVQRMNDVGIDDIDLTIGQNTLVILPLMIFLNLQQLWPQKSPFSVKLLQFFFIKLKVYFPELTFGISQLVLLITSFMVLTAKLLAGLRVLVANLDPTDSFLHSDLSPVNHLLLSVGVFNLFYHLAMI